MLKRISSILFFTGILCRISGVFGQTVNIKDSLLNIINAGNENIETVNSLNRLSEYYFSENLDSSIISGKKALVLSQKISYKKGTAESFRNLGRANTISGNYKLSIGYFYKALKINEKMNDTLSIGKNYSSIGTVHYYQGDIDKALVFCNKSLLIFTSEKYETGLARVYNNMGLFYSDLGKIDTAQMYFNKTIEIAQKAGDIKIETSALGNIARNYMIKNDFRKAIDIFLRIPEKARMISDLSLSALTYANISVCYFNLSENEKSKSLKKELIKKSLEYGKLALEYANSINSNSFRSYAYDGLSRVYKATGDYKNAYEYLKKYMLLNDSMFSRDKTDAIAEIEAKYQNEKKQMFIENLQNEMSVNRKLIKKQNTIILIVIVGFLTALILSLFLLKIYQSKKNALILLDEKNRDSLKQREEIAAQRDKISEIAFELKKSNKTKNKFFSIIAHDLKNPFQGIIGFSELIKKQAEKEKSDEIAKYADYIFDVSNQTYKLLDNLLNYTRSQIGLIKYTPEKFNLKKIIDETLLLSQSNALVKGVKLINKIDKKIYVNADESMISTVFRNLISNAVKFTDKDGYVKISSENINNDVVIKIVDNGTGIKEKDISKLFKADLNFSTFGTHNEKGTGLGLVVCKDFVVKNKGSISVESKVGEGSTFTVILPMK